MAIVQRVVLLLAALGLQTEAKVKWKAGQLFEGITQKNIDMFLNENEYSSITFCAMTEQACREWKNLLKLAVKKMAKKKPVVPIAYVEVTGPGYFEKRFGLERFPSVFFFDLGVHVELSEFSYQKTWKPQAIADIIHHRAVPYIEVLKPGAEMDPDVPFGMADIVLNAPSITPAFDAFARRNKWSAMWYHNPVQTDTPNITLKHQYEDELVLHEGLSDSEVLREWFEEYMIPFWGASGNEVSKLSMALRRDRGIMFTYFDVPQNSSSAEVDKEWRPVFLPVAKQLRDKYLASFIEPQALKAVQKMMKIEKLPCIEIVNEPGGKKFRYFGDAEGQLTTEGITEWVNTVVAGTAKPTLRSEPVPAQHEQGPVRKIVSKSFNNEVFRDDQDVALLACSEGAKRCAELEHVYEKVAEKIMHYQLSDRILIAKIDIAKNDSPTDEVNWKTAPTLLYVRKGEKTATKFEGRFTTYGMFSWIKDVVCSDKEEVKVIVKKVRDAQSQFKHHEL